jgi:fucose 4-O-acetylase-like acetyltransferase
MSQITNAQTITITPARAAAAAAARAKAGSRLAYIDIVRMILIILVIALHAAVTYIELGGWTFHDYTTPIDEISEILLSLFVLVCYSFSMGLFFFLAGYFTPGSYDRKGPARFWKDRLLRLAVPLALYTLVLCRLPNYIEAIANEGFTGSIGQYTLKFFWGEADGGPTWFLLVLLAYSLGYTLWRWVSRRARLDFAWAGRLPAPGTLALLAAGLIFASAMFAIGQAWPIADSWEFLETFNLMVAFFPTYTLMFAAGVLAYRGQWLENIPGRLLRFWAPFSAGLIIALPALMLIGSAAGGTVDVFFSGLTWQCAAMCLWFGMACIALSATITLWMRERIAPQSRVAALAGPNTFAVYLIHPLVLVPITYALSFTALPAAARFGLAALLTVPACYLLADGLRRLPGAKAIL